MPKDTKYKDDVDVFTDLDDFLDHSLAKKDVVGSWGFNSDLDFTRMSYEENNVWFFEQVFNFLRAFFGIVVPDSVEVITYNAAKQVNKDNLDQMTFLDELMLIMKNLKEPIWVIKLNLSIVGFLRTDWDPDNPIRLRIQEPASFIVWGGPDESGFQTFSISYALFSSQKIEAEDVELWSMNQPLLEKALKKWEQQSRHKIEVVKGNSSELPLYEHGFKKPAPQKIQPEIPDDVDEFIPDLDDLDF